jgi:hypothetical protein
MPPPAAVQLAAPTGQRQVSTASAAPTETSEATTVPEHRRDFSPSAMPPPLETVQTSAAAAAAAPRSGPTSPPAPGSAAPYSPRAPTPGGPSKALPFVRPADIYKRVEEEERRASLESSRSGGDDSNRSRAASSTSLRQPSSIERLHDEARASAKPALPNIPERKSEYAMLEGTPQEESLKNLQPAAAVPASDTALLLPRVGEDSKFGDDFWTEASPDKAPGHNAAAGPDRSGSQQIRSMVTDAFDRSDSTRGVSKQDSTRTQTTDSGMSVGTSDISPILSRVTFPSIPEHPASSSPSTLDQSLLASKPLPNPADKEEPLPAPPAIGSTASSRSASPSKGKVRDLADRFNDHDSKRSSVVSVGSKKDFPLAKMSDAAQPRTAELVGEPVAWESGELLPPARPRIPGQWESFSTNPAPTPALERDAPYVDEAKLDSLRKPASPEAVNSASSLDLSSSKQPLEGKDISPKSGPASAMTALAAAGAAFGESIRKSVGFEDEPAEKKVSSFSRPVGDISNTKPVFSAGPSEPFATPSTEDAETPPPLPAKDNFDSDILPPPVPLKPRSLSPEPLNIRKAAEPPVVMSEPSSSGLAHVYESDRLRNEIVRSLSPLPDAAAPAAASSSSHVEPPQPPSPSTKPTVLTGPSQPPMLAKKFSWETSNTSLGGASQIDVTPTAIKNPGLDMSSTLSPANPTIGDDNPRLSGEGLHVINAQPGELASPPTDAPRSTLEAPLANPTSRFSDTTQAATDSPTRTSASSGVAELPTTAMTGTAAGIGTSAAAAAAVGAVAMAASRDQNTTEESPSTPSKSSIAPTIKPPSALPSFREIQAMKSPEKRIATFNSTRSQWASTNSGIDDWLKQSMQKYPEHADLEKQILAPSTAPSFVQSRPGVGHVKASSIGKIFTSMGSNPSGPSHDNASAAEYSPDSKDKRTSASGAGKAVGDTLKGLSGKGKGLFERMGRGRLRGGGGDGVGN